MIKRRTLSHQRLKDQLTYLPSLGLFKWNERKGRCGKGDIAGAVNSNGYRIIQVDGVQYFAHRLAWFYVHGEMPDIIDHVNRDRCDNRLCNLRVADASQNSLNTPINKLNTSGHKGVIWHKQRGKWLVQLRVARKIYSFGLYVDINEAVAVAKKERKRLHGEFYTEE